MEYKKIIIDQMKILILGGSGLVGSTLAQSLKTENEIHVTFNTHNIDENFSKTQNSSKSTKIILT